MLRSATDFILRNWFRCALVALVFGYASEYVERNEPYWEPDVAYLHWSTDVPTVTVCQMNDTESSPMYSEIDNTLTTNILQQTSEFKKKDSSILCKNIFRNCSWNEMYFNCCRHFQINRFVIEKPCFSINSLQTVNKRKKLVVSHFSKYGELKMEFNIPVKISLHGHEDIRFGDLQKQCIKVHRNKQVELLYTIQQTIEDVSLVTLDLSKRGCLLRNEKKLFYHPIYSKSACLLECFLRKPDIFNVNNSTLCECLPTCTEMEIKYVWHGDQRSNDNVTRCILTILKPATDRLVMKAKKDYIDLIVIVACLLQLFTGINLMDISKCILNKNSKKKKRQSIFSNKILNSESKIIN